MNKIGTIFMALAALTACSAPEVSSGQSGVGFNDYAQYELDRARRESQLSSPQASIIPPPQVNSIPGSGPVALPAAPLPAGGIASSELAQAGIGTSAVQQVAPSGVLAPSANTGLDPNRTQGIDASPSNPAPVLANNVGISDEQNFDAVAGRETIESDAQRRAAQAAAREQINPTAVPDRPTTTGPNIVEYAINAPNVKGQEWYSRSLLTTQGRFQRNCAAYASPDDAQRDFLARGGPERDRRGIDPDGDGFACGWDPAPFKRAAGN